MRKPRTESTATIEDRQNQEGKLRKYIVLRLFQEDKYPLFLTLSRAKLIIKHLSEIKNFAEIYDEKKNTIGKALS